MIKTDMKEFNKTMQSALDYSNGFINGAVQNQQYLNNQVAEVVKDAFYKYIDSVARLDPDRLHHVYEWGQVGSDAGRLFRIEAFSGQQSIRFVTEFIQSTSTSPSATEPFVDKASVMEQGSLITIRPKEGEVLAFQGDDGEMIFTPNEVTIEQPGGPGVRGSFAETTKEFFTNYLDGALLKDLIFELSTPTEFTEGWNKGMTYASGQRQARKYLTIKGGVQ